MLVIFIDFVKVANKLWYPERVTIALHKFQIQIVSCAKWPSNQHLNLTKYFQSHHICVFMFVYCMATSLYTRFFMFPKVLHNSQSQTQLHNHLPLSPLSSKINNQQFKWIQQCFIPSIVVVIIELVKIYKYKCFNLPDEIIFVVHFGNMQVSYIIHITKYVIIIMYMYYHTNENIITYL